MNHINLLLLFYINYSDGFKWEDIDLPSIHLPLFFNQNPEIKKNCEESSTCPYKYHLSGKTCWGYEENCAKENFYSNASCPGHHKGWVSKKEDQLPTFYTQGDFGYVKEFKDQLQSYCKSEEKGGSSLVCSDQLHFCRAQNIMIDFGDLQLRQTPVRYNMDVLRQGKIGGFCRLDKELLEKNIDFISPLQSWAPELRYFTEFDHLISKQSSLCDFWIDKATIITKIDASVSMYHHFCDFFNLYASQHVNNTGHHSFSRDTQVLIWETYPYASNFGVAWKAFTQNPIWNLDKVAGKRICFRDVMFPLLPRMIFGLYYNTPIIWGCENSGLFHAFSHHLLHRLGASGTRKSPAERIHVTFISRQTKHRRVLNEDQLLKALRKDKQYIVRQVEYSHKDSFLEQLKQDQWTDILIGIHGAGLTHLLFLPDWAVVIELYDCGDPNCYRDLARLRGVKYLRWDDQTKVHPQDEGHHPDLGAHEKFTNYSFDEKEFVNLVQKAAKIVRQNLEFSGEKRKFPDALKTEL